MKPEFRPAQTFLLGGDFFALLTPPTNVALNHTDAVCIDTINPYRLLDPQIFPG